MGRATEDQGSVDTVCPCERDVGSDGVEAQTVQIFDRLCVKRYKESVQKDKKITVTIVPCVLYGDYLNLKRKITGNSC